MQNQISQNIKQIFAEFSKIGPFSKGVLKYGTQGFLALFALGTILFVLNRVYFNFDINLELTATSVIKQSFTIFAEIVICSLLIDSFAKKYS